MATSQTLTFSNSHSTASVVLNKVTGETATTFAGSITASDNVHFILVNGIAPASVKPLEEVQDLLVQALRKQWQESKQQEIISQLFVLVKFQ